MWVDDTYYTFSKLDRHWWKKGVLDKHSSQNNIGYVFPSKYIIKPVTKQDLTVYIIVFFLYFLSSIRARTCLPI